MTEPSAALLTSGVSTAKWSSVRHGAICDGERCEVFISPAGDWYKRCEKGDTPDLEIPMKTSGIPPLQLKCINHWKPVIEEPAGPSSA